MHSPSSMLSKDTDWPGSMSPMNTVRESRMVLVCLQTRLNVTAVFPAEEFPALQTYPDTFP